MFEFVAVEFAQIFQLVLDDFEWNAGLNIRRLRLD